MEEAFQESWTSGTKHARKLPKGRMNSLAHSPRRTSEQQRCVCRDCGQLHRVKELRGGHSMYCTRCDALLRKAHQRGVGLAQASAALGVLLLILAMLLPGPSVAMPTGISSMSDLFSGVASLFGHGRPLLGLSVAVTLVLLPLLRLSAVALMPWCRRLPGCPFWLKTILAKLSGLGVWTMVDVFLLGAMISLFRLRGWMHVSLGPALFALMGVAVCSFIVDLSFDAREFWQTIPRRRSLRSSSNANFSSSQHHGASKQSVIACSTCETVQLASTGDRCERCEQPLESRKSQSLEQTLALSLAALLLLIPANVWPVMEITRFGRGGLSTIWSGTVELTEHGLWSLALIVFVASILVPAIKLIVLGVLLLMTKQGSSALLKQRTKAFRLLALIGRWSMVDIFATMMLVTLARFGWLGSVYPGVGASAFCLVVVFTMWAVETFDPRLMWDAAGKNTELLHRPLEEHDPQ